MNQQTCPYQTKGSKVAFVHRFSRTGKLFEMLLAQPFPQRIKFCLWFVGPADRLTEAVVINWFGNIIKEISGKKEKYDICIE